MPTNGKSLLSYLNLRNPFLLFVCLVTTWSQLLIAVRSLFMFRCTRVLTNELKHHSTSPSNTSWELSPPYCFSQYSVLLTWKHLIVILFSCLLHLEKKQSGAVVMWQVSKGGGRSPHSRKGEPKAQILLKPFWAVSSSARGFHLAEVSHRVPLLPSSLACKIAVP